MSNLSTYIGVIIFIYHFGTVINAQPAEDVLEARKKEIAAKMTMNYIEYNRGVSSPVVANIRIVDTNSDVTYNNVVLDDQSLFPDATLFPNAYAAALSRLDFENAVKATTEPYYGIKYFHFLKEDPAFALGVDFTHFKIFITDFNQSIHRTGVINGASVDDQVLTKDYFKWFSISHGINHISLTAIYRLMLVKTDKIPDGMIQPFVGLGFGPSIPHGELTMFNEDGTESKKIYSYRVAFPNFGFDLSLGVRFKLDPHFCINLVYKYSYSMLGNITFDNGEAGHVETFFPANHLQWGLSFIF